MNQFDNDILFSVVIPVYNTPEKLLRRCLNSILNQSSKDIETIIIDDGSDISNSMIYSTMCNQYSSIKYYKQDNSGPSAARNHGVEISKGKYILFLDADDYITEMCIEQAKKEIHRYHPDILIGYTYKDLADEGTIKYKTNSAVPEEILISGKSEMADLLNHMLGFEDQRLLYEYGYIGDGPCSRFFKRELYFKNQFDTIPQWSEDTLWNIGLLYSCKTAVICKSLWYVYAVRKGSTTQSYRSNCYEEFRYITEKEINTSKRLWKGKIEKGISYRVWVEIFILSRALIFNSKNKSGFVSRFKMLKDSINSEPYQVAIHCVDFSRERRMNKKILKRLLNLSMKYHLYILSFFIIKIYVGRT